MSSKRDLYHAASKTNVGQKKRKPLIQGKLVLQEPKQLSQKPLAQGQPPKLKDDAQDPTISPIKSVPKLTEDTFPQAEPPSECLDLSDADDSDSAMQPPVLVCDASHLGVSPDGTEVDVVMGYEPSPVKVVCHTPGKLSQSARQSPAVRSSKKIMGVDQGRALPGSSLGDSQSNLFLTHKESPRIARGSSKLAFLKELSALEQSSLNEPVENTPTKSSAVDNSARGNLDPESDTCSLADYLSPKMPVGNDKITQSQVAENLEDEKSKEASIGGQSKLKKAKSFRVVQSRYMQPSLSQTLSLSKATLASSKESSGHHKSSSRAASNEKQVSKSGNSSQKPIDRKTSTPTFDEKSHYLDDISAIHSASTMSFCLGAPASSRQQDASQPLSLPKPSDLKQPKAKANKGKIQPKSSVGAKSKSEAGALELDFAYTQCLQWQFLKLKSKKALATQDASALSEVNGLWRLLEFQKEELSNSRAEVSRLKKTLLAEEILEKSERELGAAVSSLPVEEYSTLSSALDTTRHQLPVKEILMPESDAERVKLEQEMDCILSESGNILTELKGVVEGKKDQLAQYADSLKTVDKCYSETCAELHHFKKDLGEVQSLTTHMTSLFVQNLQAGDQRAACI